MKKKRILVVTLFILVVVVITIKITKAKQSEEESLDILYQDVILTALAPSIDKAINDYYKNVLSYLPGYDFSFIKILNIERPNADRASHFIINIEVEPYIGPHIAVGKDRMSIDLSSPGTQVLTNFEHLEDYPLPDHYKDFYIQ